MKSPHTHADGQPPERVTEQDLRQGAFHAMHITQLLEATDLISHIQPLEQQDAHLRHEITQLRALSQRLIAMLESERRYMAYLLLDEIAQPLSVLKLLLERSLTRALAQTKPLLDKGPELLAEVIAQLREVALDLRPTILDQLGLLPALLSFLQRYTARTRVRVSFRHAGLDGRLPPDIETLAYRLVEEALGNVARHADTSQARVCVSRTPTMLILQVEDDGAGFDAEATLAGSGASGLIEMLERTISAGGRLHVESKRGTGTRVTAEFPLAGSF